MFLRWLGHSVRSSEVAVVQWRDIHYSQLGMAAINLYMSCISHLNYTAGVESTPINVKNGNRLQWMARQTESVEEPFFFFLTPKKALIPPSSHNVTMEDFIIVRGKRFTDLGEIKSSLWWNRNTNLHKTVLPFLYSFVPTSKDQLPCDYRFGKLDPNSN